MAPSLNEAKCVLVIGATAGIGRALALAIYSLPHKPTVIVAGRRQERLDELTQKDPERIKSVSIDTTFTKDVLKEFVEHTVTEYPNLDTVIFSSGVQHIFHFTKPEEVDLDLLQAELTTNYTSIVTLITYFLPHFLKLSDQGLPSFIIPITSGLAIVPAPQVPNYSTTKAALHSFALSLDSQLKGTNVHVAELLPPLVESELHDHQGLTPRLSKIWMPLTEFTEKAMTGLLNGDVQVPIGMASQAWERFEKGKLEQLEAFRNRAQSTTS